MKWVCETLTVAPKLLRKIILTELAEFDDQEINDGVMRRFEDACGSFQEELSNF